MRRVPRKLLRHTSRVVSVGVVFPLLGACGGAAATDPELPFEALPLPLVVATGLSTCALKTNGEVDCWGSGFKYPVEVINGIPLRFPVPDGPFVQIRGAGGTCGLKPSLGIHCWGTRTSGSQVVLEGRYIDFGVSGAICGVSTRGRLNCIPWSELRLVEAEPFLQAIPDGSDFRRVALGGSHACALRADGSLSCWGKNPWGGATAPDGSFVDLGVGDGFTCAVRGDGSVACWGALWDGSPIEAPDLHDAIAVDAERARACALRATGEVSCWGTELAWTETETKPPLAKFRQLSVGASHACGVTEDDGIACWGEDNPNQALQVPEELR